MAISIVLADDHPLVRQGMREILEEVDTGRTGTYQIPAITDGFSIRQAV